jgi:hypothetical protein
MVKGASEKDGFTISVVRRNIRSQRETANEIKRRRREGEPNGGCCIN